MTLHKHRAQSDSNFDPDFPRDRGGDCFLITKEDLIG